MNRSSLPRILTRSLAERLSVMPAVIVTGARQTGKSTLVKEFTPGNRRYYSLDEYDVLDAARRDPDTLLGGNTPITLDEVQRVPELLRAVKLSINRNRAPGRFLLTGSANLLLMRRVSESLAGRASYLTLRPMSRREQLGLGRCGMWEELIASRDEEWPELLSSGGHDAEDWGEFSLRGGFPIPAVHAHSSRERAIWFDGYLRTYLERDLQDLSAIDALPEFRRLMTAACHRLGSLVNQTELSRDIALPQPTVHRYLNLLEISYLLVRLPAYAVNRTKRLIKSPKLYWADTGLAMFLSGVENAEGAHFENMVLCDLLAWKDQRLDHTELCYWRTTIGEEVDFVIGTGGRLLPIEVKTTDRPKLSDASNIRTFRKEYGDKARKGLLLHTGTSTEWLTPDVLAVPWRRVI